MSLPFQDEIRRLERLAARVLGIPAELVCAVDESGNRCASGPETASTPPEVALWSAAVRSIGTSVVPDTSYAKIPVAGAGHIRFCISAPLRTAAGVRLGSLCALDTQPHPITLDEIRAFEDVAALVTEQLCRCAAGRSSGAAACQGMARN